MLMVKMRLRVCLEIEGGGCVYCRTLLMLTNLSVIEDGYNGSRTTSC